MHILAIETCLPVCSVALYTGASGKILFSQADQEFAHAEKLFVLIRQLMNEAAIDFKDLQVIACTTGPGSFTGLRVGIAAARGMRLTLPNAQFLCITTLELMSKLCTQKQDFDVVLHSHSTKYYRQEFNADKAPKSEISCIDIKALEVLVSNVVVIKTDPLTGGKQEVVTVNARSIIEVFLRHPEMASRLTDQINPTYFSDPSVTL